MRKLLGTLAMVMLAACSSGITTPATTTTDALVTTEGPLKLTVSDAPVQPGLLFVTGSVVGGPAMVTVASTRYGSVCSTAVVAHATVSGTTITLRVTYSDKVAVCTADIRAITYRAEISGLSQGAYDVNVLHTNSDGSTATVITQQVTVT